MSLPTVRPFRLPDAEAVAALILSIQQQEFGLPITLADQPDLQAVAPFYQTGCGGFWVAEAQGAIIGTLGLRDFGFRRAALRKMFVAEGWRGRERAPGAGVAQLLLDRATAHAAGAGVRELWLGTTDRFAAAHRFYERNGFAPAQRNDLPPGFPLMAVDSRFYWQPVPGEGVVTPERAITAPSE